MAAPPSLFHPHPPSGNLGSVYVSFKSQAEIIFKDYSSQKLSSQESRENEHEEATVNQARRLALPCALSICLHSDPGGCSWVHSFIQHLLST